MVVNPIYYLIQEVGSGRPKGGDRRRVTTSVNNFVKALFQIDKGELTDIQALSRLHSNIRTQAAKRTNQKRSGKARNRRAPPRPRNRKATAASARQEEAQEVDFSSSDPDSGDGEGYRGSDHDSDENDEEAEEEMMRRMYDDLQDADENGELTEPEDTEVIELEMDEEWEDQEIVRYGGDEEEDGEEEEGDRSMDLDGDFMDVDEDA